MAFKMIRNLAKGRQRRKDCEKRGSRLHDSLMELIKVCRSAEVVAPGLPVPWWKHGPLFHAQGACPWSSSFPPPPSLLSPLLYPSSPSASLKLTGVKLLTATVPLPVGLQSGTFSDGAST